MQSNVWKGNQKFNDTKRNSLKRYERSTLFLFYFKHFFIPHSYRFFLGCFFLFRNHLTKTFIQLKSCEKRETFTSRQNLTLMVRLYSCVRLQDRLEPTLIFDERHSFRLSSPNYDRGILYYKEL